MSNFVHKFNEMYRNMIKAEIITIGDELLYGQIVDTNSQWIGAELAKIGIKVCRKTSVGDLKEDILEALGAASQRMDVVLITGGLGPTKDDITKTTLCEFLGTSLAVNSLALAQVESFFVKRGKVISEINKLQASLPIGSIYLQNDWGTAPGMWMEKNDAVLISMPGVPSEMKGLMKHRVLPKLVEFFDTPTIVHKVIRTIGIGESVLAEMIENWEDALPKHIKLAYLPSQSQVRLRLTGIGQHKAALNTEIEQQTTELLSLIGEYVFGFELDEIEEVVGKMMLDKNLSISTAESCTGGYLASKLTGVAGSSAYFQGSVVAYSYQLKEQLLGVHPETLTKYGAVSEQTIIEMASKCQQKLGTNIAIATSGIAGPGGGTEDKPVGTVWTAICINGITKTKKLQLGGNREQNVYNTTLLTLDFLRRELLKR